LREKDEDRKSAWKKPKEQGFPLCFEYLCMVQDDKTVFERQWR
jgi:hypothetical protein